MRLLLLSAILLFAGCHHAPTTYYHPTKNAEDFARDNAKCEVAALSAPGSGPAPYIPPTGDNFSDGYSRGRSLAYGSGDAQRARDIGDACMRGEGWKVVQKSERVTVVCDGWNSKKDQPAETLRSAWTHCTAETTASQPPLGVGTEVQRRAAQCLVDSGLFAPANCKRTTVRR